jgi:argininosuccinate lyase
MKEPDDPGLAQELVGSAFRREVRYGRFLFDACSVVDLAHAVMLVEADLVPVDVRAGLLSALLDLHKTAAADFPFNPEHGDVYMNRQRAVEQRAPEAGRWLPYGRPRREATTTAYLVTSRTHLLDLIQASVGFAEVLLERAAQHTGTLMPDYTYLQRATPTTLAHFLLTFVPPICRDLDRLRMAYQHANHSPAGAGSTNGSRLPLDRQRLAELLGFESVAVHDRDAVWQPDVSIEAVAAVSALLANADRLAEDLMVWATTEFGFVELSDRHSRTSVIMPHKKNPYSLAYVRGVAREAVGRLTSVATLQLTPSGQLDNRVFCYSIVPETLDDARSAIQLLAATLRDLAFDADAMRNAVYEGYGGATDLAEVIVGRCQIDPTTAHDVVREAVKRARRTGASLNHDDLQHAALEILGHRLPLDEGDVDATLDPESIVAARSGMGGASEATVNEMIATYSGIIEQTRGWHHAESKRLSNAKSTLLARAKALCQST